MKVIANIVVVAAVVLAPQAAIAQIKPLRVCTTELNIYPDENIRPGAPGPPSIHMRPLALPPDFSMEATTPGTNLVTVAVAWTEKGYEAQLRQAECDFVVLTWWEWRGVDVSPTLWPPMLNDDVDRAWSMPMQAAPGDSVPMLTGGAEGLVPMQAAPANNPVPPSGANWLRRFELDGPGFQRVLMTKAYPYSHAPEQKLKDIAKQMGAEIYRVIDSRPRIEELPKANEPSKLLPLNAEHEPFQPTATGPTGTAGHLHRGKLSLPEDTPHAVVNGHNCTPGDPSDLSKHICGGAWGPCKDVQEKLRSEEEHFVLARRLLVAKGVPFEPFILLQPGGIARLKPVLDRMPEMHEIRREASPTGVIFADTLYLPEHASFGGPGPTVVVVNHIVYEGCSWTGAPQGNIWGTNGVYIFPRGESRALSMTLEQAMRVGGITNYGEKNPPPFSVIKDLDLPTCEEIKIGTGVRTDK